MPDEPLIDAELAAFLQGAVSIHVASRGADLVPRLVRGVGCRVGADRRTLAVMVLASQAAAMLTDFRDNGRVAVVFSRPSTHRSVQVKGHDARVEPLAGDDTRIVGRYRQAFVDEIAPMGFDASLPRMLLAGAAEELVAITFTPLEAFVQTPGPGAGASLRPK